MSGGEVAEKTSDDPLNLRVEFQKLYFDRIPARLPSGRGRISLPQFPS